MKISYFCDPAAIVDASQEKEIGNDAKTAKGAKICRVDATSLCVPEIEEASPMLELPLALADGHQANPIPGFSRIVRLKPKRRAFE